MATVAPAITTGAPPPTIGTTAPKGGVLGLLPEVSRDALGFMTRCTRDYGDFVRVRLGLTPCVVIGPKSARSTAAPTPAATRGNCEVFAGAVHQRHAPRDSG